SRHTRWPRDWSSDVCSSDLVDGLHAGRAPVAGGMERFHAGREGLPAGMERLPAGVERLPAGMELSPAGVEGVHACRGGVFTRPGDRKSTRLNSSHVAISYAV